MIKRILFFYIVLGFLGCGNNFNTSPSESLSKARHTIDRKELIREFNQFTNLVNTSEKSVKSGEPLYAYADIFFPDSTIHHGQQLIARTIPSVDSVTIIYYEYFLEDPHQSNIYIASFNNEGDVQSIIKTKEVSFDGSVTINKVDEQIIELEYYDFFKVDQLFKDEEYTINDDSSEKILWQNVSLRNFREDNSVVEFYYYENYKINKRGQFTLLQKPDSVNMERPFPHSSLRILSDDELSVYSLKELRRLIDEIYATHGFIFRSEDTYNYYQKYTWYQPKHYNVDNLLSDVERINIRKIARLQNLQNLD